ncbi:MAG: type II glyceraldehyde-3-phosphate dehydrogenase, partial [Methanosarcinaceae archaeon]|nr:type II glyceraldehyde-3-phosphate dehydrogenase [Methanosarcinaceae archaeon]
QLGYEIYTLPERLEAFDKAGISAAGTLEDLIEKVELVVDCTPGGIGAKNKELYEKAGVKAIWQGGEAHELAGFSFNAASNYKGALGRDFVRVFSCNTTGLCRVIYPIDKKYGVKKARVTLVRRAADPNDAKTGPINAIVPNPIKLPSHHGPDVKTVIPHINITSAAMKIPTTLMHLHTINLELEKECTSEDIKDLLRAQSRVRLIGQGISSTAEVIELARDLKRPRNDMWENCVWEDSITLYEGELYFFQAIHQESDVVPENVDAIRAMLELESEAEKSIAKTNKALGF